MLAIAFIILYGYKRILEYYELKYSASAKNIKHYKSVDDYIHEAINDDTSD
ncbi:hypothetical protein [Aminipila terrae]|uniref:Uncharacterized protein n=1 Tax=Aminipila terrae TaxID=2697030 RepID=A0A6P1MCF9_9FIRM|nr:hypothetical protein [Aminipila terrae]QHI72330.1 hypothetical protein Ami3637_07865 [Aminipila terrae]